MKIVMNHKTISEIHHAWDGGFVADKEQDPFTYLKERPIDVILGMVS